MKRLLLVAAVSIIAIIAAATSQKPSAVKADLANSTTISKTEPAKPTRWIIVLDRPPACATREQMDKIIKFHVEKDIIAMSRVWDTCSEFVKGTEVVIEENPIFSDNLCARVIGETHCLWTNKAAVQRQ
jgi:hypothetical protein